MSIPASLREGPRTTNTLAKKYYIVIYLLIITLGAQPTIYLFWIYWKIFYSLGTVFFIIFPFIFLLGIIIMILFSTLVSKIFLTITNCIYPPKQGIYVFDKSDRYYCYWSLRSVIKKWPIWLARQLSIPFFETLIYKTFGVSTPYFVSLHDSWIDCEFIKIGKNTKIGQGTIIMSNLIVRNKLIIKEVIIGNNVIIGSHSLILPGTVIGDNVVIESNSITTLNQHLDNNMMYSGKPAKKLNQPDLFEAVDQIEQLLTKKKEDLIDEEYFLKAHVKELSVPFYLYIFSGIVIIGCSFVVPGLIFYFYLFEILTPGLFSLTIVFNSFINPTFISLTLLTPIIFISIYLLHLFFVALFTKFFYKIADKRGPSQGIYDRNLDASIRALDYYHYGSFLMKYPIFVFSRSPFPWLLNWELKFINSNKIGKGTVLEETFLHSHITFGNNCYLGTSSHITNHLVDGVYGDENLTFLGVEIGDNVILNAITGGLPGTKIGDDATLLPGCTTLKYDKLMGKGVYEGFPARKLDLDQLKKILGGDYIG
ncbi:MAG: DapH/DapD/GlmU-related protein, partial [Candidatus Thorarchaeota archaeon]